LRGRFFNEANSHCTGLYSFIYNSEMKQKMKLHNPLHWVIQFHLTQKWRLKQKMKV